MKVGNEYYLSLLIAVLLSHLNICSAPLLSTFLPSLQSSHGLKWRIQKTFMAVLSLLFGTIRQRWEQSKYSVPCCRQAADINPIEFPSAERGGRHLLMMILTAHCLREKQNCKAMYETWSRYCCFGSKSMFVQYGKRQDICLWRWWLGSVIFYFSSEATVCPCPLSPFHFPRCDWV